MLITRTKAVAPYTKPLCSRSEDDSQSLHFQSCGTMFCFVEVAQTAFSAKGLEDASVDYKLHSEMKLYACDFHHLPDGGSALFDNSAPPTEIIERQ